MTRQERSWILYDWAHSAYSVVILAAVFPIFFKGFAAHGIAEYQSTSALAFGNSGYVLIVAVLAPILGTIADFRGFKKRFFLGFFLLGVLATLALVLTVEGRWLLALAVYMLSGIGYAGSNIFYDSFIVDVTPRERMNWVSASGFGWGYLGGTILFVIGLLLIIGYKRFGFATNIPAVKIAFGLTAVWWLLFTIPLLRNVEQAHFIERTSSVVRDSFRRIAQTLRDARALKLLFGFLIAYFFYIDGVDTIIIMATSYGTDAGLSANSLLVILLLVQIVAFPFALVYGKLADRTSARFMILLGIIVYIVITAIAFFLPTLPTASEKTAMFLVLAMLVATSQGGIQALSRSMYGRLVPQERSAEFFGFYNIFGKFSAIIGPALLGLGTTIFHTSRAGVLSLVILFIAGGVLLVRLPLQREGVAAHSPAGGAE